jgi:predicted MPP superfamily phosphohydrolase
MSINETPWLTYIIYYGSFLVFPFLYFLFHTRKSWVKKWHKVIFWILAILSLLFIWSRFIEPQIIITRETMINAGFNANIILIADMHLGAYKGAGFMERVVEKINNTSGDMVLIAGDFTYWPNVEKMDDLMAPLAKLNKPAYAVLGNHDVEKPGPPVREAIADALEDVRVELMNNNIVQLPQFTLVGLGSNWAGEDDIGLLNRFGQSDNIVVLTHNPDTTLRYQNPLADVTLTGHTHCGQIRIPWLYKTVIPTEGMFDKGYTREQFTRLFVTCGLGEVGLPMRLLNPPVIDVLNLR